MKYIDDQYFISLSDHLKDLLEKKDIDISEVAAAANLDRRQVYRLINKENVPKLSTLIRISLAAGIEPYQLFDFNFDFENYMISNNILKATPKNKNK